LAFQHIRTQKPFFSLPFGNSVHKHSALACRSHILGFGYPHNVPFNQLSNPWKPLSAPNAHRLHPSELYSLKMIEEEFPLPSPLLRFFKKPRGLPSALQRLAPILRAVPLLATGRISPGRGRLLSWVFSPLGLFLPWNLPKKHLPFSAPLSFLALEGLSTRLSRNHRVFLSRDWQLSPRMGRRSVWRFSPSVTRNLFKIKRPSDYFFISMPR